MSFEIRSRRGALFQQFSQWSERRIGLRQQPPEFLNCFPMSLTIFWIYLNRQLLWREYIFFEG